MAMFVARAHGGSDAAVPLAYTDATSGRGYSCDPTGPDPALRGRGGGDGFCRHAHYLWRGRSSRGAQRAPRVLPDVFGEPRPDGQVPDHRSRPRPLRAVSPSRRSNDASPPPVLVAAALALAGPAGAQPIVIDHTCTRYELVPESYVAQAKAALRVGTGTPPTAATRHRNRRDEGVLRRRLDLDYPYAYWGLHAGVFMNDYWATPTAPRTSARPGPSWRDATVAGLGAAGCDRNVVMWSWCGGVSGNSEADINATSTRWRSSRRSTPTCASST